MDGQSRLEEIVRERRPRLGIAVGLGWGVRNYLLSDTYQALARHFEIVILSPYAQLDDFCRQFEALGARVVGNSSQGTFVSSLLGKITVAAFYRRRQTSGRSQKLKKRFRLRERKTNEPRVAWAARMVIYMGCRLSLRAAHVSYGLLNRLYRRQLRRRWQHVAQMRALLQSAQVDAVFSTNCIDNWEWGVILAAEAHGLPVVTAITSWDNPTTKRFPICDFDGYVVWSPLMRDELRRYMDVKETSRIHVTGAPQFDYYFRRELFQTREQFCQQYGLEPQRKIIVYSTVTPGLMPDNPRLVAQLHDLCRARFHGEPQLLVRLHPKDRIERYADVRNDPARRDIVWTLAGQPRIEAKDQWCPKRDDIIRAVNTVRHGDVNVHAGYSTMMLDFAALDKPVVLLGFDGAGNNEQARIWESYEHLLPIVRSGAFDIAYDWQQAEQALRRALEQPELRSGARREIVALELGTVDGKAGVRVADAVRQVVMERLRKRQAA